MGPQRSRGTSRASRGRPAELNGISTPASTRSVLRDRAARPARLGGSRRAASTLRPMLVVHTAPPCASTRAATSCTAFASVRPSAAAAASGTSGPNAPQQPTSTRYAPRSRMRWSAPPTQAKTVLHALTHEMRIDGQDQIGPPSAHPRFALTTADGASRSQLNRFARFLSGAIKLDSR